MKRVVILGAGFGGVYTALELERRLDPKEEIEILLVNNENFLLFTPLLHEVAAGELDPSAIVNPIHRLFKRVRFFCGRVLEIDQNAKSVTLAHGIDSEHYHTERYDHLVLALGSVTQFYGLPGLEENALTMKSLGDALTLRNQMIASLEEADFECSKGCRNQLLTFVVAGAGFAGVETVAGIGDFLHHMLKFYRNLTHTDIRVVLVSSGAALLPELDRKLGEYAGKLLAKRGIEIFYDAKVTRFQEKVVSLSNGVEIPTSHLVWTAGTAPHPLLASLSCKKERGRVITRGTLEVEGAENIWAVGDCALIPSGEPGKYHPPTAQHAIREAKTLARNILATFDDAPLESFHFKTIGQLASLGRRRGVAQILGFRFSGFIAWWMWRTIYLMKLPRLEKRIRVAIDWTLDIVFAPDNVQLPTFRSGRQRVLENAPLGFSETGIRPVHNESAALTLN